MTTALLIIFSVLVVMCVILFCIAKAQVKRADEAEEKALAYSQALADVKLRAEHLRGTAAKQERIEEAADEERQELARTADSDLVSRANNLFGVPDDARR